LSEVITSLASVLLVVMLIALKWRMGPLKMSEYCKYCGARCAKTHFIQRTPAARPEGYCTNCFNYLLQFTMKEINAKLKSKSKSKPTHLNSR